jgi:hypothetical protein
VAVSAALSALLYSIWMAHEVGLSTLYGDQWRIVDAYLSSPFPLGLLEDQNGHRPVFPNLIHYFNIIILRQNQTGVMWFGFGLGALSSFYLGWVAFQSNTLDRSQKLVLSSLAIIAVLHTGNGSTLYESNDAIHSYLVLIPLFAGLWLLAIPRPVSLSGGKIRRSSLTLFILFLLGTLATFSFGAGAVVFPTFVVMAVLNRKGLYFIAELAAYGTLSILVYVLAMPENHGSKASTSNYVGLDYLNFEWAVSILKWLGAPISSMLSNSAFFQWLGPDLVLMVEELMQQWLGPALALILLIYISTLAIQTLLGRRKLSAVERVHLGIAISMIGVGLLIAYTRRLLWHEIPSNPYGSRYFVWSSLIWLAAISLIYIQHGRSSKKIQSAVGLGVPALFILLSIGSNFTAPTHTYLLSAKKISETTALWVSLGLHPGNFWAWIGVVQPNQIISVGKELKARGIPVLSSISDEKVHTRLPLANALAAPQLPISVSGVHKNGSERNWYAQVSARYKHREYVIYVLDVNGLVVGLMIKIPTYRSVGHVLAGKHAQHYEYHGAISNYSREKCYFYAVLEGDGQYRQGTLKLDHDDREVNCNAAEPASPAL